MAKICSRQWTGRAPRSSLQMQTWDAHIQVVVLHLIACVSRLVPWAGMAGRPRTAAELCLPRQVASDWPGSEPDGADSTVLLRHAAALELVDWEQLSRARVRECAMRVVSSTRPGGEGACGAQAINCTGTPAVVGLRHRMSSFWRRRAKRTWTRCRSLVEPWSD